MKKILVYGAAEFGQVVKNLVQICGHDFAGFIDDYNTPTNDVWFGTYEDIKAGWLRHEGRLSFECGKIRSKDYAIAIAIGYKSLETRWKIYEKVKADGYKVVSLIHPQAIVDRTARMGEGVMVMSGAVLDYNAEIKDLVVMWNGAIVCHDDVIGENTFLSPNSTVCGFNAVGRNCFIGAGAVISDHLVVPDNCFVKAGDVSIGEMFTKRRDA